MIHKPNFFVFTGGPGVGKTTLIRQLQSLGERFVEESARAVIREQVEAGGSGVPWIDNDRFVDLTVARDIAAFDGRVGETRRVFFDRGIMDSFGANGATRPNISKRFAPAVTMPRCSSSRPGERSMRPTPNAARTGPRRNARLT